MSGDERLLGVALSKFNDPRFRQERATQFPGTRPLFDARAAAYEAMVALEAFGPEIGTCSNEDQVTLKFLGDAVVQLTGSGE